MSHYKHFTTKEREKILFFLAQEKTISFIAKELQRDKSSVSREIKRNTNTEGIYSPSYAQKQYEIRRRKCGRKPLLLNADINKTVQFLFLQYQWSPEQISFRLKHEKNPIQISYATIYRGIYRGFLEEGKLSPGQRGVARKLRHKGKTRNKNGCIETRGKIKISHHISERPEQANQRERIGDWEADTVAGVTGKACLVTLVDRKSRYLLCEKVAKKDSISVKQGGHLRVCGDDLGEGQQRMDDVFCNGVGGRGFCTEDAHQRSGGQMPGLDLVVLMDEVQQVELLALILVQALGLDIEHGIGVHSHLLGVQQPVGQCFLVGLFHSSQLAEHRLVLGKGQQFFQLGGVLAEAGANVLFQRGGQARVALQQPAAEGDAVGLIVELFRVHRLA